MAAIQWQPTEIPNFYGSLKAMGDARKGIRDSFSDLSNVLTSYSDRQKAEEDLATQNNVDSLRAQILGFTPDNFQTNKEKLDLSGLNPNGKLQVATSLNDQLDRFNAKHTKRNIFESGTTDGLMTKGYLDNQDQLQTVGSPYSRRKPASTSIKINNGTDGGGLVPQLTDEQKIAQNIPLTQRAHKNPKTGVAELDNNTTATSYQSDAAMYSQRMDQSAKDLNQLLDSAFDPTLFKENIIDDKLLGFDSSLTNGLVDEQNQVYQNIQDNWGSATLRDDTGAVMGKDEMRNELRRYFPQIGDSSTVVKNKGRLRVIAEEAMRVKSGGLVPANVTAEPEEEKVTPTPAMTNEMRQQRIREIEEQLLGEK